MTRISNPDRPAFRPSGQQAAFLGRLADGEEHIVLAARAGTGKSTTCREGAWSLGDRTSIYCCFNKHIAREFQPGLPRSCNAATLHSLGYKLIRESVRTAEIDADKVDRLAEGYLPGDHRRPQRRAVARLVSLCKSNLLDGADPGRLEELAAVHDVRVSPHYASDVFEAVAGVVAESAGDLATIDFDDMVWLPVVLGIRPSSSPDVLFVDEAQDLNPVQHALVDLLCPAGRMVVVGDEFQSIYAFRGADSRSMPKLHDRLAGSPRGVVAMPLNVTRRCPASVVDLAKKLVPDIRAMDDAPAGEVATVDPEDWASAVDVGDMVLCRTNAPLVSACYRLLKAGVRARVVGRDVGEGLASLIRMLKPSDVGDLVRRAGDHRARELRKLDRLRNPATAVQVLNDRCDCLVAMCEDASTVDEVLGRIARMFSDDVSDDRTVTLSSVHRSKGLERGNVTILRPDLLPGPWAKDEEALQQERNLLYVAITRAKSRLTFAGDLPGLVA